ncbi:MAG: GDP-mannose 4,6-dehydratase [Bacteroidota bacterium]|nr:GDP-mannose 4,6-dehydratase [Bacteroidota bacterium]
MNILVTGGAGFIGSNVADAFINEGHNVIILDNFSSGKDENVNPKAKVYRMDIQDAAVENIFRDEKIEVMCHHAAQMDVRKSVADPKFDASVNVLGFLNLMEAGKKHGLKKVIFSSTGGAIYGEQDYFPADEEHPMRPLSPYGITKLTTEKYLFFYKEIYGIDHVILRYANIYGPRQNPHGDAGVVAIFTLKMLKGEQPIINGDGKQTRDYVFVGDVVKANILALNYKGSNIFNIGTEIETDVNQLFHHIKKLIGSNAEEKHIPAKAGEQMRSVITSKKINEMLGWKPTVSVEEGLKRTVEFFKLKV